MLKATGLITANKQLFVDAYLTSYSQTASVLQIRLPSDFWHWRQQPHCLQVVQEVCEEEKREECETAPSEGAIFDSNSLCLVSVLTSISQWRCKHGRLRSDNRTNTTFLEISGGRCAGGLPLISPKILAREATDKETSQCYLLSPSQLLRVTKLTEALRITAAIISSLVSLVWALRHAQTS